MSLILAVQENVGSLKSAKAMVETLLDGREITLQFDDPEQAAAFCASAEQLGAIVSSQARSGKECDPLGG
ncbi:MAG TPA: hypothetical protein VFH27_03840 [Longimicrobiaceae bacterium]|nr:hypothetical protein [Longimicrobiaceae bacterium]